jgi:hypothetical protein
MTSSSTRRQRRRPARAQQRSPRQQKRTTQRQHTDYAQDYVFVRRDMRRIAIWSILLFVCMFGAYFFI